MNMRWCFLSEIILFEGRINFIGGGIIVIGVEKNLFPFLAKIFIILLT